MIGLQQSVEQQLELCQLSHWSTAINQKIHQHLSNNQGNIQSFITLLERLPSSQNYPLVVRDGVICIGDTQQKIVGLDGVLQGLRPWRKGPFRFFSTLIDSEWQCQKKWDRTAPLIDAQGASVLDAGGGNGYFSWRVMEHQPERVVVCDSSSLYWSQFFCSWHFLRPYPIAMLPITIEEIPLEEAFDIILCMGVLYHSPAPFSLLRALRQRLRPGGVLILETLVVDGGVDTVLTPTKLYAAMRNVWAIPSIVATERWLQRCGFRNIEIGHPVTTTADEQRVTQWTNQKSLVDFLDQGNSKKTIEGYPAPQRALFRAYK